ncbi:MAG: GntR family transcriptional regulator [Candidatus Hydrogenedentes bacterium]|nr:GntR family transcriptional regulator [Candidatus Hydrogenedentota bacterium]
MALSNTLFRKSTNTLLDQFNAMEIPSTLPTEKTLAEGLDISRSTLRKMIVHLAELGLIALDGRKRMLLRPPRKSDYFKVDSQALSKTEAAELVVLRKISSYGLKPGQRFSELELANEAGCNTVTIREVLLRISRLGLIHKKPRQQWEVLSFTIEVIDELIEMRHLIESFATNKLLKLPDSAPIWSTLKTLLKEHIAFDLNDPKALDKFPDLDKRLHTVLMDTSQNRYVKESFTMCFSLIYYQMRSNDIGTERIKIALMEHKKLLRALIARDSERTDAALNEHMASARVFMRLAAGFDR